MIQITKEISVLLREKHPDIPITITNRQSNHKKYYTVETAKVINFIRNYNRANTLPKQKGRGN